MLDENDVITAILKDPEAQDALRLITRIAIREVALRSNSAPPIEDTTVIGKMTIDRLRRTVTVKGQVRPIKQREFAPDLRPRHGEHPHGARRRICDRPTDRRMTIAGPRVSARGPVLG